MENFWQRSKLVYSDITKALVLASVICKQKKFFCYKEPGREEKYWLMTCAGITLHIPEEARIFQVQKGHF